MSEFIRFNTKAKNDCLALAMKGKKWLYKISKKLRKNPDSIKLQASTKELEQAIIDLWHFNELMCHVRFIVVYPSRAPKLGFQFPSDIKGFMEGSQKMQSKLERDFDKVMRLLMAHVYGLKTERQIRIRSKQLIAKVSEIWKKAGFCQNDSDHSKITPNSHFVQLMELEFIKKMLGSVTSRNHMISGK